jgi:hypothetical protein
LLSLSLANPYRRGLGKAFDDTKIPEARKWQRSAHGKPYTFSEEDHDDMAGVWSGPPDWAAGEPLEVIKGTPEYAAEVP